MLTSAVQALETLLHRGGWVMPPLLLMSGVSVALLFERGLFWSLAHRPRPGQPLVALSDALRAGDTSKALSLASKVGSPYRLFVEGVLSRGPSPAASIETAELLRPRLERFGAACGAIVAAAPLLGILGTVTGIIRTFGAMDTAADAGALQDASLLAGGIAEALLTTAAGLVVALGTLLPHAVYRAQANLAVGRMEMLAAAALQGVPESRKA